MKFGGGKRRAWRGPLLRVLKLAITLATASNGIAAASQGDTRWNSGSGLWTDAARWSAGLPDAYRRVEVHGNSAVMVPPGDYVIANLEIGLNYRVHASVVVDGGRIILLQDSLRIGELSGGGG